MQPEHFIIRHRFQDVDDFAQTARAWDLNIKQLERGRFKGDLLQFGTGNVMVAQAEFYPGTYQQGIKKCRYHIVHGNGFGNSVGLPAYEPICSRLPKILWGTSFGDNESAQLATLYHH